MGERRIHDVSVGNPKDQFAHRNPRKNASFAQEPVIGRALEFKQRLQIPGVIGKSRQNGFIAIDVFGGNQAMRIAARYFGNFRKIYRPPRRASSNCLTRSMAGCPPLIM